jgi:hypothetical protein
MNAASKKKARLRVERRRRWPRGLAAFALGAKKRGDPCENPSLSTQRLRHNQGPLGQSQRDRYLSGVLQLML